MIDPGDPPSWPADVARRVTELTDRCRALPDRNPSHIPSHELRLEDVDSAYEEEERFRDLLGDRPIAFFHATRLLPHEVAKIQTEGVRVISEDLRNERLDNVIDVLGDELGTSRLEALRAAGPLSWDDEHRRGRLGLLWGVTPFAAFDDEGHVLLPFLENWGGETFYWAAGDSPELGDVVAALTARSAPCILELAVFGHELNPYKSLWKIFVGQLDGWRSAWNEAYTKTTIPPERIVAWIDATSERWPYPPGTV